MNKGWIGIDLDGTLAQYETWQGIEHIGAPILTTLMFVKQMLAEGVSVKIVTARCQEGPIAIATVQQWCIKHLGECLPVTDRKDMNMVMLIDDRTYNPNCVRCVSNIPPAKQMAAIVDWHTSPENPMTPQEVESGK